MNKTEAIVQDVMNKHGLDPRRYQSANLGGKSPDFEVYKDDTFAFFCEVKGIDQSNVISQLANEPPLTVAGGEQPEPKNRLTSHIHTAVKQFDSVNPNQDNPNVLVIVNENFIFDYKDLLEVLSGKFIASDGSSHPLYRKYAHGRIKDTKYTIHLYLWVEDGDIVHKVFNPIIPDHQTALCNYFGVAPQSIKEIGT
jgi:hypothetical protein